MRCPDCNKFVGLDFDDPEVESIDVDADGSVEARVRIVRTCVDCSTELKDANLELETTVDVTGHMNEGEEETHELSIEQDSVEQIEESGGRFEKSYFGASVSFHVTCSCNAEWKVEGKMDDKIAASGMDEIG